MIIKHIYKYILFVLTITINTNTFAQEVRNFELKDINNKTRSYHELRGENLTLIDFWATWCSPCKKAIPKLNEIYEEYRDKGVEIIGVNGDGPRSVAKVIPFSRALKIKYPVLLDINSNLKTDLNLVSYPSLIIVNSLDEIIWTHEGYSSGDDEIIRQVIEKNLPTN